MTDFKHWCGNCQIKVYVQRHYGRTLTWVDCPYTCEYATAMRCSTGCGNEADDFAATESGKMSDLIDRQAALDALEREKTYSTAYKDGYTQTDYFKQYNMGLTDGIKALKNLPSAQPVKHGRWERKNDGVYCSECHLGWDFIRGVPREAENFRYCPICGARMDGEQDE